MLEPFLSNLQFLPIFISFVRVENEMKWNEITVMLFRTKFVFRIFLPQILKENEGLKFEGPSFNILVRLPKNKEIVR